GSRLHPQRPLDPRPRLRPRRRSLRGSREPDDARRGGPVPGAVPLPPRRRRAVVLRLFYACYFAGVGASVPFFPPYLRSLGLSGRQISLLLAVAPLLHLGVPIAWGWIADRTRRPDLVLRLVCLTACLLMVPLVFVRSMPAMLLLYAGHQAFAVPIVGLTDAIALERVRHGADYGRIRVWGSLAFALSSLVLGWALDARGRSDGDPLVPTFIAGALALAFLV